MSKELSILGIGASGSAAARLALQKGEEVYVSDTSTDARASSSARELESMGAVVQLGYHDLNRLEASRMVVVSPGIPADAPVLQELRARGVRWVSEPEFAVRFHQGPLIAVTGTNGKTTTAVLTAHLLRVSGIDAALGGNVGGGIAPTASDLALRDPPWDLWVLEMSSFQLADIQFFSPDVGVLTNLATDHLDRYSDTASYFADKGRLFENATNTSRWVVNGDDPAAVELAKDADGELYLFALEPPSEGGDVESDRPVVSAFVREGVLTLRVSEDPDSTGPEEPLVPRQELRLLGRHNVMNALAAALTARLAGADTVGIREGLASFSPLPHRLEPLGEIDGVLWVNDSKATNVAASVGALESFQRSVVLLLGGRDKGEDFRPLAEGVARKARAVILYGEAAVRLAEELSEAFPWEPHDPDVPVSVSIEEGFDHAVETARSLARPGDVVLLSPACASFDLFESYEERGSRFTDLAAQGSK